MEKLQKKKKQKEVAFNLYMSKELNERVRAYCIKENYTMSNIVRVSIEQYLERANKNGE